MLTLLHEVHFWTQKDVICIKDTDFGAFKYYDKKHLPEGLYFEGKRSYMAKRGLMTVPSNKRPNKIRDGLKELEDILCHNRIIASEWRSSSHFYLVVASGLKINIKISSETGDIEDIYFDKFMLGKLNSQYISDVGVSQNQAIFTYTDNQVTLVNFLRCSDEYETEKKWSSLEPKIQAAELSVPPGRRVHRRLSYNSDGTMVVVWWKRSHDEVYPWSPTVREEERANVHIYTVTANKLELRCFFHTEHDPINICFSAINPDVIHSVQQRISQMGEVTLEWSIIEIVDGCLETSYVVSVMLPTHACVTALSPREESLFIGCIDGSILIADNANNLSDVKKAYFIPSLACWHPGSALIVISNERGQMQWFDRALYSLKSQMLSEDATPTTILDLSGYFKYQPCLLSAAWNSRHSSSSASHKDDLIILRFERGPLVGVKVSGGRGLQPTALVSEYLSTGSPQRALNLLLTFDWEDDSTLPSLQAIVSHLLSLPLTPDRLALLEGALGSYRNPRRPILSAGSDIADSTHDLSRRVFHHLLRYQLSERAFALAAELDDYDLFMDLHHYGKVTGDSHLATAALQRAATFLNSSSSEGSGECSGSCSCCSSEEDRVSPPPLPVLSQRFPGQQVEEKEPPPDPPVDPPSLPLPPISLSEEVECGKIKVVHFGLV